MPSSRFVVRKVTEKNQRWLIFWHDEKNKRRKFFDIREKHNEKEEQLNIMIKKNDELQKLIIEIERKADTLDIELKSKG